ncbi:MAG: flagellar motor protein MotB [Firmicutes bacterium]|nr:flagellar motor protein MotB [Bacillota bacterium]
MGKRKKAGGGGANWMDTYGDMVTLLLCFFVLLYSMSTLSVEKWEILVKSFNPDAMEVSQIVVGEEQNNMEDPVDGTVDPPEALDDFDQLYYQLSEYIKQNSLEDQVEISKGDGFTFITFRDHVFFDGDSYILKDEGKAILDVFSNALSVAEGSIEEIQVLGHTSQASPTEANEPISDRFLASNRATTVLLYIQEKNIVDPAKLVSSGFGQFRPISSFETRESRARNRRVEILITKTDSVVKSLQEYYEEVNIIDSSLIDSN